MRTFGVIVVLYQPTRDFLDRLAQTRRACPHVMAVDNSPQPDLSLHESLRQGGGEVIYNANRGGLAGAYNRGAEGLLARGCEAFFLLDQDSEVEDSFFEKMIAAANELHLDEFLLGPKIYEVKLERHMPLLAPGKYLPRCVPVADLTSGLFPTLGVISSGSMVSAAAYRRVGPFREDYFIDYLDGDYSMRARRAGVPIYLNAGVTLRQSFGNITRHGKLFSTNHPAWRRYYVARNCVHCFRTYPEYVRLHWLSSIVVLQQVVMVLLFEAGKRKKLLALAAGYMDGIGDRLGTIEEQHPWLAAWCEAPTTRRRLSHIEHIVQGKVVYCVRVNGPFAGEGLRSALDQAQRKHPALRALLRGEGSRLYYDNGAAPEIPLRIVRRGRSGDYRRECERELREEFGNDEPLFRVTWLRGEHEHDLLFATSHRICDGASMLILVREIVRNVARPGQPQRVTSYPPITPRHIIADYRPPSAWKRKLAAWGLNRVLGAIPESRRPLAHHETFLEWRCDASLSERLAQSAKQNGVSVHAMLLVALDRALPAAFGGKVPKWIENPMDIHRGRFPALKDDTIFFAGGNFKVMSGQSPDEEFWRRARSLNEEIHEKVARELREIPGQLHFLEMLRPISRGQVQTVVRVGDWMRTRRKDSGNRFALSNLGRVAVLDDDAAFQVTDLRIYMHSVTVRALCLVTYTFRGEMRFYCMGDEQCLSAGQADALRRRFMELLENAAVAAEIAGNRVARAAGGREAS